MTEGSKGQKIYIFSISHWMFWKIWVRESIINKSSVNSLYDYYFTQFDTNLSIRGETGDQPCMSNCLFGLAGALYLRSKY